jgi:hypothetical protein
MGRGLSEVVHKEQIGLRAALEAARKRDAGDAGAWLWNRRDDTDISPLVAATLAVFAHSRDIPDVPEANRGHRLPILRKGLLADGGPPS